MGFPTAVACIFHLSVCMQFWSNVPLCTYCGEYWGTLRSTNWKNVVVTTWSILKLNQSTQKNPPASYWDYWALSNIKCWPICWSQSLFTSLAKELMFSVALVCLFVCWQHYSKSYERIVMNFMEGLWWWKEEVIAFWWRSRSPCWLPKQKSSHYSTNHEQILMTFSG